MLIVADAVSPALKTGVYRGIWLKTRGRVVHSTRSHVPGTREVREGVVVAVASCMGWCRLRDEASTRIFHSTFAAVWVSTTLPSTLNTAPNAGARLHTVHCLVVLARDYSPGTCPSSQVVAPTGSARWRRFSDGAAPFTVAALTGVVGVAATISLTLQTREDGGVGG